MPNLMQLLSILPKLKQSGPGFLAYPVVTCRKKVTDFKNSILFDYDEK